MGKRQPKDRKRSRSVSIELDRPRDVWRQSADAVRPHPKRDWPAILTKLTLCGFLAAGVAGLSMALQSPSFSLSRFTITGASPAAREQVLELMAPGCPDDGGDATASCEGFSAANVFLVNARSIEEDLKKLPAIQSASVRIALPDQLVVDVVERQPEVAWIVGATVYRVAGDGTVIDQGDPAGLKLAIGDTGGPDIKPGDHINVAILQGASILKERLPDFSVNVKRIEYSQANGLAVIGEGDLIAMFGPPNDLPLKMAELQQIVQLGKDKKIPLAFVDLRYKTPYYRAR